MKANYEVKDDEKHLYHVRFVKILKEGKRTKDTYIVQKFHPKEWIAMTKGMGKKKATIEMGLAGITQMDEIESILHDPTKKEVKKPAGRPKAPQKEKE